MAVQPQAPTPAEPHDHKEYTQIVPPVSLSTPSPSKGEIQSSSVTPVTRGKASDTDWLHLPVPQNPSKHLHP